MNVSDLYIDLLKKKLSDYRDYEYDYFVPTEKKQYQEGEEILCKVKKYSPIKRATGADQPTQAETMIGLLRLNNLEKLFKILLEEKIEGDCLEAGVWKGGASIFMNALNKVLDNSNRKIWVADSFEGLPKSTLAPDLKYNWDSPYLKVSLEEVKKNFRRYNLLDENVHFVKGWFCDTLPSIAVEKIALLRLDGDMYESTLDILNNLYHKVVPGGFIVVDDYSGIDSCSLAVDEFRAKYNISDEIIKIDWTGVYWRKS